MMRKQVIRKTIQSPDGQTIAHAQSIVITSDDCPTSDSQDDSDSNFHPIVTVHVSTPSSHSSAYSSSHSTSNSASTSAH